MPEETLREIILSIAGNHDPTDEIAPRQSNMYGSTHSIFECYVSINRQTKVLQHKRKSIRTVHRCAVKNFQPSDNEIPPAGRPSFKIQADKMIQEVRKSFSKPRKGACKRL